MEKSKADELRDLVQSKLPHANVFWDPAPDAFFDTKPCELIAVNRNDPEKKGTIRYPNGFPDQPVETLAEDFVAHIGPEVTEA